MKIHLISYSDLIGGASRATLRLHLALLNKKVDSSLIVEKSISEFPSIISPKGRFNKILHDLRPYFSLLPEFILLKKRSPTIVSPAILPSRLLNKLKNSNCDIVNLHWINNEMISISQIGKINKPVVWTLHDMWAFCGMEHYSTDNSWKNGYGKKTSVKGVDLNAWTWRRKKKYWKKPITIVCPSQWLANCVRQSKLMSNWPVHVIPNALDTNFWRPINKVVAREALGLDFKNGPIILFGALGGTSDPRKGFEIMKNALIDAKNNLVDSTIIIFGGEGNLTEILKGFNIINFGHISDDYLLRLIYSAADLMVIPSLLEAFGQTGSEAQSCGTPVIAFNNSGLVDVVLNNITGKLVNPNFQDLSIGICQLIADNENLIQMGLNARKHALNSWSYDVVADKYISLYRTILNN